MHGRLQVCVCVLMDGCVIMGGCVGEREHMHHSVAYKIVSVLVSHN